MGVGAAVAEAVQHGGARTIAAPLPSLGCRGDLERRVGGIDQRVQPVEMQLAGNGRMAHRQHDLDQADHARCRRGMPDMGLRTAQQAEMPFPGEASERPGQSIRFDDIAERRAGPMGFDVADRVGRDAEPLIGLADQRFLRRAVGRRDAVAGAVLVHAGSDDGRMNRIAIAQRIVQALQHHDGDGFRHHRAVGLGREGVASPSGRQHADLQKIEELGVVEVGADAAGQRHRRLAAAQALTRQMQRHGPRGAAGVHDHGGAAQIQEVGEPCSHQGVGLAAEAFMHVVGRLGADVDPDTLAIEPAGVEGGILQRPPAFLKDQALVRIHGLRFTRRDGEEQRIEAVAILEQAAPFEGPHLRPSRGKIGRRQFANRVVAGEQVGPEHIGICSIGKLAG